MATKTKYARLVEIANELLEKNREDVWERARFRGCSDWDAAMDLAQEELDRDED